MDCDFQNEDKNMKSSKKPLIYLGKMNKGAKLK